MAPKKNINDYEQERMENIRRNQQKLAKLNIGSLVANLAESSKRSRDTTKKSPQKKPKVETVPVRRSLRGQGKPPDSEGLKDNFEIICGRRKKLDPSVPNFTPDPDGPFSLEAANVGTQSDNALVQTILKHAKEECDPVSDTKLNPDEVNDGEGFDLVKGKAKSETNMEESELVNSCFRYESMTLNGVDRMMSGKIYVVKFYPSSNLKMVVAGNNAGNLGFWKMEDGEETSERYLYKVHTGSVSGIVFQQSCPSKIYTSCYDGFIRMMDAEKEVFDLMYSCHNAIYSLAQKNENDLYFGEAMGSLNFWDLRTKKSTNLWFLHDSRINTIDFNPGNPHIMATSSSDASASLWDLRYMARTEPQPVTVTNHHRAIQSAYFSPSGRYLATTSIDDKIGVWGGNNFESSFTMIKHNNQTGTWISSFRGIWGWDDSSIFIGNMNRGLDVISRTLCKPILTLENPEVKAIPCRLHAHPYEVGTLAAATSGGEVYVWSLEN